MPLGDFKSLIKNNFVDLYLPSDIMIKYNMSHLINLVQNEARIIEPNIYDEKTFIDIDEVTEEIQNGYRNFDVINLCNTWISSIGLDEEFKEKAKKKIQQLYTMSTSSYNPEI